MGRGYEGEGELEREWWGRRLMRERVRKGREEGKEKIHYSTEIYSKIRRAGERV